MHDCLLLGQDHGDYGVATTVSVGERAAATISVGADTSSPSLQFKGSAAVPNEDALCIVDQGDRVVMVVADAHFGHESSHVIVDWLYNSIRQAVPTDLPELITALASLSATPDPATDSESTLVIAMFDRAAGRGTVLNFGDSTFAVVTAAGELRQVNTKDDTYVAAGSQWPAGPYWERDFEAATGDTLLMFTDGVDECHYRNPATSVTGKHILEVVGRTQTPGETTDALALLALAGVDGHPGGQDNIAIIAAMA